VTTGYPEPPPPEPDLDAIIGIEQYTASIMSGDRRFVWWDRALWWRTYRPGGFDGYRTLTGRRLPCATMEQAVRRPDMRDEIRQLSRR
jgi:hypothetical protein